MRYGILYLIALIFAVSQIFGFPGLIVAVLMTLMISLLSTMSLKKSVEEGKESAATKLNEIGRRVDDISRQVTETKSSTEKSVFALETRVDEVKTDYRLEMESQYRDLAKKIIDVENRLIEIRKTVGAAVGSLEDRLESR